MIALDTNVLVRYLVEDDAAQTARAAKRIAAAAAGGERLFVSTLVMCEVAWVLSVAYKTPKVELIEVLSQLLRASQLVFEDAEAMTRALDAFERGRGDIADYVIRDAALAHGCESVATFDRALLREAGFIAA